MAHGQVVAADLGDTLGHVLDVFAAFLRGNDDFLELRRIVLVGMDGHADQRSESDR